VGRERDKGPWVPRSDTETVRHGVLRLLETTPQTLRQLSSALGVPEKSLVPHLEHLQRSLRGSDRHLRVEPARCKHCGFVFAKRERIERPGRCPVCKGESLTEPVFSVTS